MHQNKLLENEYKILRLGTDVTEKLKMPTFVTEGNIHYFRNSDKEHNIARGVINMEVTDRYQSLKNVWNECLGMSRNYFDENFKVDIDHNDVYDFDTI